MRTSRIIRTALGLSVAAMIALGVTGCAPFSYEKLVTFQYDPEYVQAVRGQAYDAISLSDLVLEQDRSMIVITGKLTNDSDHTITGYELACRIESDSGEFTARRVGVSPYGDEWALFPGDKDDFEVRFGGLPVPAADYSAAKCEPLTVNY